MTARHYDLGDLSMTDTEDKARTVLQKLRDERLYKPTHLYRGVIATPAQLKTILKRGTDRNKQNHHKIKEDPAVALEQGSPVAAELRRIEDGLDNDTNAIWAAPEAELESVINNYATAEENSPKTAKPTVLVYDGKKLAWRHIMEVYDFKKGVKPLDALVAVFTFQEF